MTRSEKPAEKVYRLIARRESTARSEKPVEQILPINNPDRIHEPIKKNSRTIFLPINKPARIHEPIRKTRRTYFYRLTTRRESTNRSEKSARAEFYRSYYTAESTNEPIRNQSNRPRKPLPDRHGSETTLIRRVHEEEVPAGLLLPVLDAVHLVDAWPEVRGVSSEGDPQEVQEGVHPRQQALR